MIRWLGLLLALAGISSPSAYAQMAEPVTVVTITLSWEALVAVAVIVLVVVVIVKIARALVDWIWPPPPPRPRRRICHLRMHHTNGVNECVYDCYLDETYLGSFTWELAAISRLLGRELSDCPLILHGA